MELLPNIGLFDICLSSLYGIIIFFIGYSIQLKKIKTNPAYKYFIYGVSFKIVGSVTFAIISIYYYQGGDTFRYFGIAENLRALLFVDFKAWSNLMVTSFNAIPEMEYNSLGFTSRVYERGTTWFFARVLVVFNCFSFGSYLVASILMSVISFIGIWLGYISFVRIYPLLKRALFIPFFLIPTALFWSSGILRDTLVIGVFGVLIYSFYNAFITRNKVLYYLFVGLGSLFIMLLLKPILFYVLVPSFVVWGLLYYFEREKSIKSRAIHLTIISVIVFGLVFSVNYFLLKENQVYKIENLFSTLEGYQTFYPANPIAKSTYSIGHVDASLVGVLKKTPEAMNVTFFRPYIWEVESFALAIAAIESLVIFLAFLLVVLFLGKKRFVKVLKNKELVFLLLFSLGYGTITGLSATDYGALTRFKIPAVLCFCVTLIILEKDVGIRKVLSRKSTLKKR